MKYGLYILLMVCTLGRMDEVSAHAVVTNYSLKIAPIQAHKPDKVSLFFNSQIEIGLSQVFLVRKGDNHELLHAEKGNKQGEVVVNVPALDAGDYALSFKIFAADGHLTEDVIRFTVDSLHAETAPQ
jgi:methionine-rich copper-binding protein CopC